jgi:hypothetical protein
LGTVFRHTRLVLAATSLLVASGCLLDPDLDEVMRPFERQVGRESFRPEVRVRLGRSLLTFAKGVMAVVSPAEADEIVTLLKGVDELHLGIYSLAPSTASRLSVTSVGEALLADGWALVSNTKDSRCTALLFGRTFQSELREILVIVCERDELTLAKMEGDLTTVLDAAVRATMRSPHETIRSIRDAVERSTRAS